MLGISRQAYYQHKGVEEREFSRLALYAIIVEFVQTIRQLDARMGCEKLWEMFTNEFGSQFTIGRDAFIHVCGLYGLVLQMHKRKPRTTDSRHNLPVYPNLVSDLKVTRPFQVWVSDITYMQQNNGLFCYLSLITDAYSRMIVGWSISDTLSAESPYNALKQACECFKTSLTNLIHHSDRGCQYASTMYTEYLHQRNIRISMTQSGDPTDNPIAERANGIIKNELLSGQSFNSMNELEDALRTAIDFYNNRRPHRSIDMKTPAQAALLSGELTKRWPYSKDKYRKEEEVMK